ncbi:MAG: energy-coupling factor transporter transmembrane protein EcfT [Firmicutes bacterium]|jgi:energy-coupling factor transport system permease protein|nr:energy-coupling factor transporter transmembrane protein EcfT [Bacillota bacterium]MDH7495296.1 energy-coupling factor transporter transmembrane component T [Bacillota bacterium]
MIVEYESKDTPIHSLDPRAKILWLLVVVVVSVIWSDPVYLAGLAASVFLFGAFARFPWGRLKGLVTFLAVVAVVITLAQGVSYTPAVAHLRTPGRVLFHVVPAWVPGIGPAWPVKLGGFLYGIGMTLKVLTVLVAVAVLGYVTSPSEIVQLIARIPKMPYQVGFIVSTAWKFVPVVQAQVRSLMDAHKSKGVELERGSFVERLKKTSRVVSPLFANALFMADTLALAMESRAFGSSKRFTFLRPYRFKTPDYVVVLACIGAAIASVVGLAVYKVGAL